jgi:hypothetical protein
MNKTTFDASGDSEDEMLPEYDFDYSKAKPNRFAMGDRLSEKAVAEQSFELMQSYAARVDYAAFDAMMAKVPDVPPMPGDEL